jgi:hypothetical protein
LKEEGNLGGLRNKKGKIMDKRDRFILTKLIFNFIESQRLYYTENYFKISQMVKKMADTPEPN